MQKCISKMRGDLTWTVLIFPKDRNVDVYLKRTSGDMVLILTTVVLGASTLKINRCFPRTTMDCLASALSFPSSVCQVYMKIKLHALRTLKLTKSHPLYHKKNCNIFQKINIYSSQAGDINKYESTEHTEYERCRMKHTINNTQLIK